MGRRTTLRCNEQWFIQDGDSANSSPESWLWLEDKYEDKIMSLKSPQRLALHSRDLNHMGFFVWGYSKVNVYIDTPTKINQLEVAI